LDAVDKILDLLEKSSMTDKEFIIAIGSDNKNIVSNWRDTRTKSYLKYIPQIAKLFDVSADYLLDIHTTNKFPEDLEQLISLYSELSKEDREQVIRYVKLLAQDNKSE